MDGAVLLASTTEQAPTTRSFYITGRTYPWDVLVNTCMVTNNEATIKKS
jgi:hypothetical protein